MNVRDKGVLDLPPPLLSRPHACSSHLLLPRNAAVRAGINLRRPQKEWGCCCQLMACFAPPQEGAGRGSGDGRFVAMIAAWETCKRLENFVFVLLSQVSQTARFMFTKPDIVRVTACND